MAYWGIKTVLRLLAVVGVLVGMLTLLGCADDAAAQTNTMQCDVFGVRLESAAYEPMTGKAEVVYTYAGRLVVGTAHAMANLSRTENQARLEAYKQAKNDAFEKIGREVCKPHSEPAVAHK